MKKKRTLTIVAMVLAVLLLGVGYAAINDVKLYIEEGQASATPSDANFNVAFDQNAQVTTTGTVTAAYTDATHATFSATGLSAKGDKASATYTIKNSSADLSATLAAVVGTLTGDATYFNVTHSFANTTIAKGASTTLTVTVELVKTPVEASVGVTFPVTITASALQPAA